MKKYITLIAFLFCSFITKAEYNNHYITFVIDLTNGKQIEVHREFGFISFENTAKYIEEHPEVLFYEDKLHSYKNLLVYKYKGYQNHIYKAYALQNEIVIDRNQIQTSK